MHSQRRRHKSREGTVRAEYLARARLQLLLHLHLQTSACHLDLGPVCEAWALVVRGFLIPRPPLMVGEAVAVPNVPRMYATLRVSYSAPRTFVGPMPRRGMRQASYGVGAGYNYMTGKDG